MIGTLAALATLAALDFASRHPQRIGYALGYAYGWLRSTLTPEGRRS